MQKRANRRQVSSVRVAEVSVASTQTDPRTWKILMVRILLEGNYRTTAFAKGASQCNKLPV